MFRPAASFGSFFLHLSRVSIAFAYQARLVADEVGERLAAGSDRAEPTLQRRDEGDIRYPELVGAVAVNRRSTRSGATSAFGFCTVIENDRLRR